VGISNIAHTTVVVRVVFNNVFFCFVLFCVNECDDDANEAIKVTTLCARRRRGRRATQTLFYRRAKRSFSCNTTNALPSSSVI